MSALPVLAAGILAIRSIKAFHKEDIARLEGALIEQSYNELKKVIDTTIIEQIHVKAAFKQTSEIDLASQKFLLKGAVKEYEQIEEMAFVNLKGQETARFTKIFPDGVPDEYLRNVLGTKEFSTAKDGKDYISDVFYTLKGPMVVVASPTKNADDEIISVTTAVISLKQAVESVGRKLLGSKGYLYLVDRDGFLVGGGLKTAEALPSLKNVAGVNSALAGNNFLGPDLQMRYKNFFGESVVAAGRFVREWGLGVIAEWPVVEADKSVNDLISKTAFALVAVVVLVILASLFLSSLIVRPIRVLEKGTERIAEGKFEEKIEIKTKDELEDLGNAFNKMMAGLKRLEELKDEFVFIAAHELRTPVAAMKGYLSLILDGTTGAIQEQTKDFIAKVIHANDRLVQLVNDLLEVSRSEVGKLTIKVAPIDIMQPIRDVLTELEKMAEEKKVEIKYAPFGMAQGKQMPKVLADPDRLKEVVVNLVGNSIKYMGPTVEGRPREVMVSHELVPQFLVTHVQDSGLGMSADAQKKLFEKFYRIARDETKNITGTGLGLFIVREIIEKMGGKIWAASDGENKGSTFSFSLPLAN